MRAILIFWTEFSFSNNTGNANENTFFKKLWKYRILLIDFWCIFWESIGINENEIEVLLNFLKMYSVNDFIFLIINIFFFVIYVEGAQDENF